MTGVLGWVIIYILIGLKASCERYFEIPATDWKEFLAITFLWFPILLIGMFFWIGHHVYELYEKLRKKAWCRRI